jgi:hypothetical protein
MTDSTYPDAEFLHDVALRYFVDIGCDEEAGRADFVCFAPESGIRWVIEIAAAGSLDPDSAIRVALGNLLARMDAGPEANYVLVSADLPEYAPMRERVPGWAREVLNLTWFVVDRNGEINAIPPYGPIDAERLREATARELERWKQ